MKILQNLKDTLQIPDINYKEFNKLTKNKRIIISGVGKAGLIGKLFTDQLVSISIPATYLDPLNALHGDMGIITKNSVLILFSNSGKTNELINLISILKHKIKIIIITSGIDEELARYSDLIISLGVKQELKQKGILSYIPTLSILKMQIISISLIEYIIKKYEISIKEFGLNHFGGYLGQIINK